MSLFRQRPFRKSTATKPSFVSYIHDGNSQSKKQCDDEKSLDEPSFSDMCDEKASQTSLEQQKNGIIVPEPSYLPGEVMISKADNVIRYIPYSDCHQGSLGTMIVTNFRIHFVSNQPGDMTEMNPFWVHKLYRESDIILNNIQAAYQISKHKRKKLVTGKEGNRLIKKIELHCKDFQLHQFSFERAKQEEANMVINTIAHFAFPDKLNRQFAFSYQGDTEPSECSNHLPDFMTKESWEAELKRLACLKSYRVTDINMTFGQSQFMPMFFVVPSCITDENLRSDFQKYENYRVPVWCYTHKNGVALIRMTFLHESCENQELIEADFREKLKQHNPGRKKPVIFNVHEAFPQECQLPSVKDIKHSYEKLKAICMPAAKKVLGSNDSSWYRNLESTKWLTYVTSFLKVSVKIARIISGDLPHSDEQYHQATVAVKEHNGARDLAPVVTSLVQLLLDPYCHSTQGFQMLIEKEWVALGHCFKDRYGLVTTVDGEEKQFQCPVFLMFLDCVYQLQRQMPMSFEFSEYYLTLLWDCVCSGLFVNFLFNCQHEMISENCSDEKFLRLSDKKPGSCMLNVWDVDQHYTTAGLALLINPLYSYRKQQTVIVPKSSDGHGAVNPASSTKHSVRILNKYRYYTDEPGDMVMDLTLDEEADSQDRQEYPAIFWNQMRFWSGCFLRWLTPIQIVGGGSAGTFILESILVEEIRILCDKIKQAESGDSLQGAGSHSEMAPFWTTQIIQLMNITSSFPYSPARPSPSASSEISGQAFKEELTSSTEFHSSVTSTISDQSTELTS